MNYDRFESTSAELLRFVALDGPLSILSHNGLAVSDDSLHAVSVNEDPWLVIGLAPTGDGVFGLLRMSIQGDQEKKRFYARVYFDYGEGWNEKFSIGFELDDAEEKLIVLMMPAKLRAIRVDPDDKISMFTRISVSYRDVVDQRDIAQVTFDHVRRAHDLDRRVSTAVIVYDLFASEGRAVSTHPFAYTKFLTDNCSLTVEGIEHLYPKWVASYASPSEEDYEAMQSLIGEFKLQPSFSFIVPVYKTDPDLLQKCISSLLRQNYSAFEICIVDDCPGNAETENLILGLQKENPTIKFLAREHNGHISAASNSALSMATGDFIVLVDHDDEIPDFALFVVASYINKHPHAKVLFSDEDKIDLQGQRCDPYFKSDFDPFLMFGHNMVSHLGVYDRSLVENVGGFREGLEGSQDYDLFLRCYERIARRDVIHIPHVLYHWRMIPGSTAVSPDQKSYAHDAALNAINGYFERNDFPFRSVLGVAPGLSAIKPTRQFNTEVSVIIPTKDNVTDLKDCLESVLAHSTDQYEVIVVSNRSECSQTLEYLEKIRKHPKIRVIEFDYEFNYSKLNNFAATFASGKILCMLNDDTVVMSHDWLNRARSLLSLRDVGIVGARLLFEDDTLQHFGVWTGCGAHLVAATPHRGLPSMDYGYFGKARLIQEFNAVTAACCFIDKKLFERVGGFEEALPVAYNDVDLCLKVRSLGLRIVCDPDIMLIHKESKTRGHDVDEVRKARLAREASYMTERWNETLLQDPYRSPNLSNRDDRFSLAFPPRVNPPWKSADGEMQSMS